MGRGDTKCSLHTNKPQGADFRKIFMTITESIWHSAITCPSIQRLLLFEIRVCKDKMALRVMTSFHSTEHFDIINWRMLMSATTGIMLFKQRTTKVLIRMRGYAGWSAPLLFAYGIRHVFFFFFFFAWPGSCALKKDKVPLCDRNITFFTTTNKNLWKIKCTLYTLS